jgi:hypothetical protein
MHHTPLPGEVATELPLEQSWATRLTLGKVFASDASRSVAQPSQDHVQVFASEAGLALSQLMSGDIPTMPLAWK